MKQIDIVQALTAYLGVEIVAAVGETTGFEDFIGGEGHFLDAVGELVGVPAVLRVATIGVDAAEDPQRDRRGDFVMKAVPGQRGMVGFDVDLDLFFQAVLLQKTEHRGAVVIVLMLGGLLWLGFDQQVAFEADLVFVLNHHAHETTELFAFVLEVGIEQGFVTFTTAPQHVIGAFEALGRVHRAEHLGGSVGKYFRVRVAGSTCGKARVAETVGRAPQQLDAALLLMPLEVVDHLRKVITVFLYRAAFRRYIGVVETVVINAQFGEEFERCLGLADSQLHRVTGALPWAFEGANAKHVSPRPDEGVPVAGSHAQVFAHGFAEHPFVGVVVAKGKRRVAVGAFVDNLVDSGEVRHVRFLIVIGIVSGDVSILATASGPLIMKIINRQCDFEY
ncbi:hypothetical protein ALP64_203743 [Pseudomonas syringae pv. actinidiae]|nr:hypothetical protein ALP64_203743 [Pseudomonas syringae pv. actinidiae]